MSLSSGSMKEILRWADYPLAKSDLPWRRSEPCIDSGWLVKLGNVRKSYKKRWFKIIGRTLYYYAKPSSDEPLGSVSVEGAQVQECGKPASNQKGFFFQLIPCAKVQQSHKRFARSIMLRATTARNRSEWIESLNRCTLSASKTVLLAAKSLGQMPVPSGGDIDGDLDDISPWNNNKDEEELRSRRQSAASAAAAALAPAELESVTNEKEKNKKGGGVRENSHEPPCAPALPPTLTLDSKTTLSQTGRISRPRAFALEGGLDDNDNDDMSSSSEDEEVAQALHRARLRVRKAARRRRRKKRKEVRRAIIAKKRSEKKIRDAQNIAKKRVRDKKMEDIEWVERMRRRRNEKKVVVRGEEGLKGGGGFEMEEESKMLYSAVGDMQIWQPSSSTKRARPSVRSTELARFELNDRRMLAESRLTNKVTNASKSKDMTQLWSTLRSSFYTNSTSRILANSGFGGGSGSGRSPNRETKSHRIERADSKKRGMHHLYGLHVLDSRHPNSASVKTGVFYHGHPSNYVAPVQYSASSHPNSDFNRVKSHSVIEPMTPPSKRGHPLQKTRARLLDLRKQKEEDDEEEEKQDVLMMDMPTTVHLNLMDNHLSPNNHNSGGSVGGGGGGSGGGSGDGRKRNRVEVLPPKKISSSSPIRTNLQLNDLMVAKQGNSLSSSPPHPPSISIDLPSPPCRIPTLSENDTDAAIQILESSLQQLDERLMQGHDQIGSDATSTPRSNTNHYSFVPTYLKTLEEVASRGDGKGSITPRVVLATNVSTRNGSSSSPVIKLSRPPRVRRNASYENGRSPYLKTARGVTLGRKRSSSIASSTSSSNIKVVGDVSKVRSLRPLISATAIPFEAKQQIMEEWERESHDLEFIVEAEEMIIEEEEQKEAEQKEAAVLRNEDEGIDVSISKGNVNFDVNKGLVGIRRSSIASPPQLLPLVETPRESSGKHHQHHTKNQDQRPMKANDKRRSHRRLPQASLDALSSGENVFSRVAGAYANRRS